MTADPTPDGERGLPEPIFIFGITQRSGTHFLYDLLLRHPQCRPALSKTSWEGSWENHLLEYAVHLSVYTHRVWESNRLNDKRTRPLLMKSLGTGLKYFLRDLDEKPDDSRRPVTKTPGTKYLDLFADLFPGSRAILLTRDPRALLASALKTFGGRPDRWVLEWRSGARRIIRFRTAHPEAAIVVRYEDLYADTETSLRSLFAQLDLDPDAFDYAAVGAMPVRGSSQYGEQQRINWHPVPRGRDFNPLRRAEDLSPWVEERIAWRLTDEIRDLGYPPPIRRVPSGLPALTHRLESLKTRARVTMGERRADRHEARIYDWRRRKSGSHWGWH